MKKSILSLIFFVFILNLSFAQRYFGVATSDWNTYNSMYNNPAVLGGCNEKLSINLFSLNFTVDQSLGTVKSLGNIINSNNNNGNNDLFTYSNRNTFSMLLPSAEIRGPGVLYAINDKHTVALNTRIRIINQFDDFDKNFYNYITKSNYTQGENYSVALKGFNWTANIWSEIGLSYGGVFVDNSTITLKGGITLRYLVGTAFISLRSNNVNVTYYTGADSLYISKSDLEYSSTAVSTQGAAINGPSGSGIFNNFLGTPIGTGIGADIGAILIVHTFNDGLAPESGGADKHRLMFSASVTDLGAITYKADNTYSANFYGNGYLSENGIKNNIGGYTDLKSYLAGQGFAVDTSKSAKTVSLPTALLLGADYNVYKRMSVNATIIANMASHHALGNSVYGQITLTPRYDSKSITVGLPITYNMLTDNMRLGLGFRAGGFIFGLDDMMVLFSNNQYGINLYIGGYIPIQKRKKDKQEFKSAF